VPKTITRGDTLWQLVRDVYGFPGNAPPLRVRLDPVGRNEPQIQNVDITVPAQKITFPNG
jgi:nucleoid-associated protein YgaU